MARRESDEGVEIAVTGEYAKAETRLARLFFLENGRKELWIPKSVILDEDEDKQGGMLRSVTVKTWWAEKNGVE